MKTSTSIKQLKKEIDKTNLNLLQCYSDIKKEVIKQNELEIIRILEKIAEEYGIDFEELELKYLQKSKKKEKKKSKKKNSKLNEGLIECSTEEDNTQHDIALSEDVTDSLMTKANVNGTECYYESKEGGAILDIHMVKIGEFKNGKLNLF